MQKKDEIIKAAMHMRICLWAFVAFTVLCLLGIPTFINLDIEPLGNNAWMTLFYLLVDQLWVEEIFDEPGAIILDMQAKLVCGGVFAFITIVLATLVWQTDRLFRQYAKGNIFTSQTMRHFFIIGWALIALFFGNTIADNFLEQIFIEAELRFIEAEGVEDMEEVDELLTSFIALDFTTLLAGMFVVAVAHVMQMGVALQDDIDQTI